MGDFVPQTPTGASPLDPTGGLLSPRPPAQDVPHILYQVYALRCAAVMYVGDGRSQSGGRGSGGERRGMSYTRRGTDSLLLRAVRRVHLRRLRVPAAAPQSRRVHVLRGDRQTPSRPGRPAGQMSRPSRTAESPAGTDCAMGARRTDRRTTGSAHTHIYLVYRCLLLSTVL